MNWMRTILDGFATVSYTHLDVYKRQLYSLALEYHGFTVDRRFNLGGSPVAQAEMCIRDRHNTACLSG